MPVDCRIFSKVINGLSICIDTMQLLLANKNKIFNLMYCPIADRHQMKSSISSIKST